MKPKKGEGVEWKSMRKEVRGRRLREDVKETQNRG